MADIVKKEQKFPTREITLERSGIKMTVPDDWTMADNAAAQRAAAKDAQQFPLYLAQRVCLFDGERRPLDWIKDNIGGKDGLALTGALFGSADDEGNE